MLNILFDQIRSGDMWEAIYFASKPTWFCAIYMWDNSANGILNIDISCTTLILNL